MSGRKGGGGGGSGRGGLHERVKTARRRTASSTRWLQRQLNDPYVRRAQAEGYRSRAAYKLIELDDKFGFLKKFIRASQRLSRNLVRFILRAFSSINVW